MFSLFGIFIFVYCIFFHFAGTEASVAYGHFYNTNNPGKCTYEELVLDPGESAKPATQCVTVQCENTEGLVTIAGCPSVAPPKHCIWLDSFVNEHAPYPKCCERHYQCSNNEANNNARFYKENIFNILCSSAEMCIQHDLQTHNALSKQDIVKHLINNANMLFK